MIEILDTAGQVCVPVCVRMRLPVFVRVTLSPAAIACNASTQDEYQIFHMRYAMGIHGYILMCASAERTSAEIICVFLFLQIRCCCCCHCIVTHRP